MDTSEKIVQLLKLSENVLESVNKIVSESEKDRIEARESRKDMDKFNRIMIQEIRDSTKSINKVISGYINNESNLIEKEINGYIRNYLENDSKFNNFTIFDISSSW
jgi:glucosamine 6-phosphate synthetase-like amidotransferase/phosphosugar isomerase protein